MSITNCSIRTDCTHLGINTKISKWTKRQALVSVIASEGHEAQAYRQRDRIFAMEHVAAHHQAHTVMDRLLIKLAVSGTKKGGEL